jgi:hypothetical protein
LSERLGRIAVDSALRAKDKISNEHCGWRVNQ